MTIHSTYSIEDMARLSGYADAIQRDMRAHLNQEVDKAIFLGNSGANEDSADITGLNTATGVGETTLTQSNKVIATQVLKVFVDLVDGAHADSLADLRIVVAEGAYQLWATTMLPTPVTTGETIAQFLARAGINYSVKGGIEVATANDDWGAFLGRSQGLEGAGIVAMWSGGGSNMVLDPYSGAAKGEISVTLHNLYNVGFVRASNFQRVKFVT